MAIYYLAQCMKHFGSGFLKILFNLYLLVMFILCYELHEL